MSERCPCNDAGFLSKVAGYQSLPQLLRLLARRERVDLDEFVHLAGDSGAALAKAVREQPGSEWDEDGQLVGFGLTSQPTRHRFSLGGTTFYTWCASDTLLFTTILGEHTVAESQCPATGVAIRLELTPDGVAGVVPADAVLSQLHLDSFVGDLRSDVCDHGHFFASPSAAAGWAASHPDGRVVTIADAFVECRAACEELGWATSRAPRR